VTTRAEVTILVAAAAGALVWALSPWLAGHREPWDVDGLFYPAALLVAGSVSGLVAPRPAWAHYVGAVVGQLGYELLFLPIGGLFLLGAALLSVYSLLFALAAAAAGRLRARLTRGVRA
jgi:hypothetical protein